MAKRRHSHKRRRAGRSRKGRIPPQLRPYLFKKGGGRRGRARRRNPARKKRRAGGLRTVEKRTTVVARRKNPTRRRVGGVYQHRRHRLTYELIAKGPGGRLLRYTGAKFSDHGTGKRYRSLAALKTAARSLRRRYGSVLRNYSLYAKTLMGK